MKLHVRALMVVLTLGSPTMAVAGLLQIPVNDSGLGFGIDGAFFSEAFNDVFIDGVRQETPWLSGFAGNVAFGAGPLESLVVDDSDPDFVQSDYAFGAGTFTLSASWGDRLGGLKHGTYVAPLRGLHVAISCEGELTTRECGSWGPDASHGTASMSVGPGRFDPQFARVLGVHRVGGEFDFEWFMDGIFGNPADPSRFGAGLNETFEVPVTQVPEPPVLTLLLLSLLLAWPFRRRGAPRTNAN